MRSSDPRPQQRNTLSAKIQIGGHCTTSTFSTHGNWKQSRHLWRRCKNCPTKPRRLTKITDIITVHCSNVFNSWMSGTQSSYWNTNPCLDACCGRQQHNKPKAVPLSCTTYYHMVFLKIPKNDSCKNQSWKNFFCRLHSASISVFSWPSPIFTISMVRCCLKNYDDWNWFI